MSRARVYSAIAVIFHVLFRRVTPHASDRHLTLTRVLLPPAQRQFQPIRSPAFIDSEFRGSSLRSKQIRRRKHGKRTHVDVASRPQEKRSGVVNQDSSEPGCA